MDRVIQWVGSETKSEIAPLTHNLRFHKPSPSHPQLGNQGHGVKLKELRRLIRGGP